MSPAIVGLEDLLKLRSGAQVLERHHAEAGVLLALGAALSRHFPVIIRHGMLREHLKSARLADDRFALNALLDLQGDLLAHDALV